jgi:hypothetical protein
MKTIEPPPISCISFAKLLVVVVFGARDATSNGSNIQASFTLAFFYFVRLPSLRLLNHHSN